MGYTSVIANQILVTPFDDKSVVDEDVSDRLTKAEFCDKCYSRPKFMQNLDSYNREIYSGDGSDSQICIEDIENQMFIQKKSYENFNIWLNNYAINKIYTINGNAGTGKTTFIHQQSYEDKKNKWEILDINRAHKLNEWISDVSSNVLHFEKAYAKFYAVIMNRIWELVFKGTDSSNDYSIKVVHDNLEKLINNYMERFHDRYPSGRKLMDEIYKVFENNHGIYIRVEESAKVFKKYINGKVSESGEEINEILNAYLLILRCMEDNSDKNYCIVFDNFERFIAKDEIYNKDIDDIRLILTSYIKRINQAGNINKGRFKFIMVVRDATARMCRVRLHASDSEASNLDLNGWYDIQDIIDLKEKWYKLNNFKIANLDIVEQIIGDFQICIDKSITGLQQLIDPLFNYNKRLIVDFFGTMIETPKNKNYIQIYKKLWDENTQQSRFAARSVIRGMILKELNDKQDKLFEHLKTYNTGYRRNNGIGDARKILTILYNNIQNGDENEMKLVSIFEELFGKTDIEKILKDERRTSEMVAISELMFFMNSYNRRENDWIQLIDIQFKNSERDIIISNPKQLRKLISDDIHNITLHLLPAGKVYLEDIVASFEFFSFRYIVNYRPLFTLVPTIEEMRKCFCIEKLECYKVIERVFEYALECIKRLKNGEDSIKILIGNHEGGKYHFERIIDKHTSYLDRFIQYIKERYCDNLNIDVDKKVIERYKSLCKEIIQIRDNYKKEMKMIYKT